LAGTGKSTIAQTIAERVFADGQLGASFFCSRDFSDRSNLHFIFPPSPSNSHAGTPNFDRSSSRWCGQIQGIAHESLYNQMNKLIVEPLEESAISTVIVIDALDECKDEEPASAILSVLGQFVSQIPKVKIFLTGRPEPRIREGFRLPLLAATRTCSSSTASNRVVNSDIRLVLQTQVPGTRKSSEWVG
jgi:hypothetical protein